MAGFVALGQFLLSATVCDTVPWTFFVPLCLYWATLAPGVLQASVWLSACDFDAECVQQAPPGSAVLC